MNNETVQDAQVVTPPAPTNVDAVKTQQDGFKAQLEATKKEMLRLQQEFEKNKNLALKLEGAIEGADLILTSLKN